MQSEGQMHLRDANRAFQSISSSDSNRYLAEVIFNVGAALILQLEANRQTNARAR